MTLRNFFVGRAVVLCVLLIIGLGVWGYMNYFSAAENTEVNTVVPQPIVQQENTNTEPPTFAWKYAVADSLNGDGNPETNVFLEAKYPGGAVETKLVDTTPGSCYDLPDAEKGSVAGTTTIQCYHAGLGYTFKITKGEKAYLVKRKTFEEGSPDYIPPETEYETVSEFPLFLQK